MVGDLAHEDVGPQLLDLVADDLVTIMIIMFSPGRNGHLVNGGAGAQGFPGVDRGLGDGAGDQVDALGRGLQVSSVNNAINK